MKIEIDQQGFEHTRLPDKPVTIFALMKLTLGMVIETMNYKTSSQILYRIGNGKFGVLIGYSKEIKEKNTI